MFFPCASLVSAMCQQVFSRATRICHATVLSRKILDAVWATPVGGGGGYSHTLPIRVCAAQRGRDFEAPDLEQGIHFRGVF